LILIVLGALVGAVALTVHAAVRPDAAAREWMMIMTIRGSD